MGREIRRVPPGWEHPKDEQGHYTPLLDEDFDTAAAKWDEQNRVWDAGTHPDQIRFRGETPRYFAQWDGNRPDPDYYRPAWAEGEATAYQVYETVSEGTPVSPVFQTEDELYRWLRDQGHSEHAAREFIKHKWAPSMIWHISPDNARTVAMGIDTFDLP